MRGHLFLYNSPLKEIDDVREVQIYCTVYRCTHKLFICSFGMTCCHKPFYSRMQKHQLVVNGLGSF
jgi:hypothetical protein